MSQDPSSNSVGTHDRWQPIFLHFEIPSGKWFEVCNPESPRVLVLCQGGNVRSAAATFLLRYKFGVDTIAASLECNSSATLHLLYAWADYIVLMDARLKQHVPTWWRGDVHFEKHKFRVCDVGPDHYGDPFRMDLLQRVYDLLPAVFEGTNVLLRPRVSDGTYGNPHITPLTEEK